MAIGQVLSISERIYLATFHSIYALEALWTHRLLIDVKAVQVDGLPLLHATGTSPSPDK